MKIQRGWLGVWGLEPGIPRTTLGANDSLGLREIRKAVILTITVYYRERIQIKIGQGKELMSLGTRRCRPVTLSPSI